MAAGAAVLGVEDLPPRCHVAGMVVPAGGSAAASPGTQFFSVEPQGLPRSMTIGFKSKRSKRQEVEATHSLGVGQKPARCHFDHIPLVKAVPEPTQTQGDGPRSLPPHGRINSSTFSYFEIGCVRTEKYIYLKP